MARTPGAGPRFPAGSSWRANRHPCVRLRYNSAFGPKWRNGRRGGLKHRWGQPHPGSNPGFGTTSGSIPVAAEALAAGPARAYGYSWYSLPTSSDAFALAPAFIPSSPISSALPSAPATCLLRVAVIVTPVEKSDAR